VNNPIRTECYFSKLGRADIEGSKSGVALNAWPPQASYPCGNFSDTSAPMRPAGGGSLGHTFMVCIHTEKQNRRRFCPYAPREISVFPERRLGRRRYCLTDVPPQPNSPTGTVLCRARRSLARFWAGARLWDTISRETAQVAVFHWCRGSRLCYTLGVSPQCQTRVKLNRVFFPR